MNRLIYCLFASFFIFLSCSKEKEFADKDEMLVSFPEDFSEAIEGCEILLTNEMYVSTTYKTGFYDDIEVSSKILRSPTYTVLPGSEEYYNLLLDDKYKKLKIRTNKTSLSDKNTLRLGSKISKIKGVLSIEKSGYVITLTSDPVIYYSQRPGSEFEYNEDIITVMSFNLDYYMASPSNWGKSNGAKTEAEFLRQSQKIISALHSAKADIYALCEIEEGNYSVEYLVNELNKSLGRFSYKYIDTGDRDVTKYTKNTFIYNADKIQPVLYCKTYNSNYLPLRHIFQGFMRTDGSDKFILSLNHFKAKTGNGTGSNSDMNDGQGSYNAKRVQEAKDCLESIDDISVFYDDKDVLAIGDFNSYSKEDPIQYFISNNYTNEIQKYSPNGWSYSYGGYVGYLDHVLSSPSMSEKVIDSFPWDINSSEPACLDYHFTQSFDESFYRCSDHNPIITILKIK